MELQIQKQKYTYLAQRVLMKESSDLSKTGVDQFFSFDYMGHAEFEYGALPASMKRIKKNKNIITELSVVLDHSLCDSDALKLIELNGHNREFKANYVGQESTIDIASALLKSQLENPYQRGAMRLKVCSYLQRSYLLPYFKDAIEKYKKSKSQRTAARKMDRLTYDLCLTRPVAGWWDIENDFVIFKDGEEGCAKVWYDAVKN